jgi:hypothetical protein
MHAIATVPVAKLTQLDPSIPREFEAIVLRAMHREPSKRFPSVHALGGALLSFAGSEGWARWGREFTGAALADGERATPGDSRRISAVQATRVDTPLDNKQVPSIEVPMRGGKAKFWAAGGVAIAVMIGAGAAARLPARAAPRGAPSGEVHPLAGTSGVIDVAPTATAMDRGTEPKGAVPGAQTWASIAGEVEAGAVRNEPAPATVKPAARSRNVPRAAVVAAPSNTSEKTTPATEPPPPRERGQNGALILE